MQIKYKVLQPSTFLKFDEGDNGNVSGYATTFDGQPDSDGDRILAGAAGAKSFTVPMLAFHDRTRPIGSASMTPDMYGVKALGGFSKTQDAQDMRENARSGGTPAFSIGFTSDDYEPNEFNGYDFKSIKIVEVSLVPIPANTRALVSAVKMDKTTSEGIEKQYADIEPPEGTFEAVQEDLCEALTDLYQNDGVESVYVQLLATFPDSVVYCVNSWPDQETDGTYQVPYIRAGHDDLTLGNPKSVEVQQTVVPDDDVAVATAPGMTMESDQDIETKESETSKPERVQLVIDDWSKTGKRNSNTDQGALDNAHEAIVKAGAYCAGMEEKQAPVFNSLQLLAEIAELETL